MALVAGHHFECAAVSKNRFSVVTLPRLLAMLAAASYHAPCRKGANRGRAWSDADIARLAEREIRGCDRKRLADDLGRTRSAVHGMVFQLREKGLIWMPAALKRTLAVAAVLPVAKALAVLAR